MFTFAYEIVHSWGDLFIVINQIDMAHIDVSSSVIGYTIDPIIDFLLLLAIPQGGQRSGSDTQMMMRDGSRDCDTGYSTMFDFDTNKTSYCLWEYKCVNDNDIKKNY